MLHKFTKNVSSTNRRTFNLLSKRLSSFNVIGTLLTDGLIVGAKAKLNHIFDKNAVSLFASVCGDNNPIHLDEEYSKLTIFKKPVVHGILISSLFSTIFGRTIHSCVYISQSLKFSAPVYVDTAVTAEIEVIQSNKTSKGYLIKCNTICKRDEDHVIAVSGEAVVLIPEEQYIKITQQMTKD